VNDFSAVESLQRTPFAKGGFITRARLRMPNANPAERKGTAGGISLTFAPAAVEQVPASGAWRPRAAAGRPRCCGRAAGTVGVRVGGGCRLVWSACVRSAARARGQRDCAP
jgi:hypothetical protein